MPWPRRIRITRGQGSLNRFALIIWAEDLSFSELSPESLCTLIQDRNASTNSRCRLTPAKETKVCPVCDTPIDANARVCPSCQTDLTLFDIGGGLDPTDTPVRDGRSIDEILASIMEGKEDHREIFETLKNVARETPESADVGAAAKPRAVTEAAADLGEQFLCPVCETLVSADATVCPGCGAEFSEGEATEYECPVCKASVPADADRCPSCGVRFAEDPQTATARMGKIREPPPIIAAVQEAAPTRSFAAPTVSGKPTRSPLQNRIEQLRRTRREAERRIPTGDRKLLYRELPKLVNEVKPLLVSAKRIGLEIEEGKRIINDAIQAGKGRDIERAVTLIADARQTLDVAFVDFIGGEIDTFIEELRAAKGDAGVQAATPKLQEAVGRLEAGDYDAAWDRFQGALGTFHTEAKDFHEARKIIDDGDRLAREVRSMGMDLRDPERLLRQGRESLDRRDVAGALRLGQQAQERMKRDVPAFVQEQMRKARNELLDLKVRGNDLSRPIGILKDASGFVKREAWGDALRQIREFHKAVQSLG
jgi:rubrerythrin